MDGAVLEGWEGRSLAGGGVFFCFFWNGDWVMVMVMVMEGVVTTSMGWDGIVRRRL